MPPKTTVQFYAKPKEFQTRLFATQKVDDPEPLISKGRAKKFSTSDPQSLSEIKTSSHKWAYGTGVTPRSLLLSCWNVNGIRSVIEKKQLQKYLEIYKPDILCVNQTKIDEKAFQKSKIELLGYHGYWNFCKISAGYSGVAIFSKYLPIASTEDIDEKHHSQQGRVLTLEFQKFYLVTAYIPNSGSQLDRLQYRGQFEKAFQNHCQKLRLKKPTIIGGDLNVCHQQIDVADVKESQGCPGFTVQERKSFGDFLEKGWIDSFRALNPKDVKYSWWSIRTGGREKNRGWRLDYFVTDQAAWRFVKDSRINNKVFGSDHCPVELAIEL